LKSSEDSSVRDGRLPADDTDMLLVLGESCDSKDDALADHEAIKLLRGEAGATHDLGSTAASDEPSGAVPAARRRLRTRLLTAPRRSVDRRGEDVRPDRLAGDGNRWPSMRRAED